MGAVPRGTPGIEVFRRLGKNPSDFSPESGREGKNAKYATGKGTGGGGGEKSLGFFPKPRNTSIPGVPRGTAPILMRPHARTLSFLSRRPPRVLPPLGLPF
ncbi:hypothetical protein NDU88_001837 [Pleurodeles waltl]|uniref:Uncharacterized protein n=1 Tax=Pleurodeles waltl TaxID=8319 RepID=A0AAV7W1M2_PLEWA|nr:hypothetical protein NDU88_001837 [Pleurodeles waltl]